ncbi:NADH-quinone oxidoreductase subunit M [Kineosporia rhizophila]|uniref:NADH-quinone oxidoreductase subunit M n=1 Tax=Kineosporia TaxID=49184 RepID=UPI001E5B5C7C|nr:MULTISPECIES: NADH-quinone oxidoreductase subunit M [Kineosporia]MCE0540547.1 NADH-quinone oxidoreductase subunit M [Kineosporia rhizophila]GLY13273.1 NADH-quinone oxidoreductase subunit M [Kineosporia sp. NBRC 101677]
MDFPWLTVIGAVPLVGSVVVAALPKALAPRARLVALGVSLATFVLTVVAAVQFDVARAGEIQLAEQHSWIGEFGVSYAVGVNGIGLVMVALSTVLVPLCVLAAWNEIDDDQARLFFGLVLVLEAMMVGVFAARDLFLFYVFFEAMLIPVYFLIGAFGSSERRRYTAVKFLVYSLVGGLVMLVGVIGLYGAGPGGEEGFLIDNLTGLEFSSSTAERLMFVAFFIAFAIKAPMWPVHTWLPDATDEAPAGVSVLLVGVLDKVGTFGMLTLCLPLFPEASKWAAPVVLALAVVSVLYGALLAIGQTDLKRLIAYTSISHFGFIVLGIFAMTSTGQTGSTLYMVNHGFSTAALFLVAGMLIRRRGSADIDDFGGLQRSTPVLAAGFLLAGLSSLALPGMSSFVSEFMVLTGTFVKYPAVAVLATLGIVLAALYILLTYQRMFTGPVREYAGGWKDASAREVWVVAPLVVVILFLGVYPKPVLDVINPAISTTMQQVGVTDPAPTVAVEGEDK